MADDGRADEAAAAGEEYPHGPGKSFTVSRTQTASIAEAEQCDSDNNFWLSTCIDKPSKTGKIARLENGMLALSAEFPLLPNSEWLDYSEKRRFGVQTARCHNELRASMSDFTQPLALPFIDTLFWTSPLGMKESAWHGHVPFAHWIVSATRPRQLVELGTHNGVSYAAMCNAVKRSRLDCKCYAVDTWLGDAQAGYYQSEVYEEIAEFNSVNYSEFSTLLRMTFQAALSEIAESSVDLLHIDGLHTYEAVSEDFQSWKSKLSERAVILFHDTEVRRSDFGVWRFWDEVRRDYPNFCFRHSAGLGVLAFGRCVSEYVLDLCRLREEADVFRVQSMFETAAVAAVSSDRIAGLEAETSRLRTQAVQLKEDASSAASAMQQKITELRRFIVHGTKQRMSHGTDAAGHSAMAPAANSAFQKTLLRCCNLFGEATIDVGDLSIVTHQDVVLDGQSLYDTSRRLITDSGSYRGVPSFRLLSNTYVTEYKALRLSNTLPDAEYFWLGFCHDHFGHFLLTTISRLWAIQPDTVDHYTYLYVGGPPPEQFFALDHVREIFQSLGIKATQLKQISGAARIPRVTVAASAFLENAAISTQFATLLRTIAGRIADARSLDATRQRPVYVAKDRVRSGVRTILNEADLYEALRQRGMEVAWPDQLSFRDQLKFWSGNRVFLGFASSAFHMAGFIGKRRLCTISHDRLASSNQAMIDALCENDHLYLHGGERIVRLGPTPGFQEAVAIADPEGMADALAQVAQQMDAATAWTGQRLGREPRSLYTRALSDEPFGVNLARSGIAMQSSLYEFDEGWPRTADGAISGVLTGHYQSHTRNETRPWWQVDLQVPCYIYEVRVFNRGNSTVGQARLRNFLILISDDGTEWSSVHEYDGPEIAGGEGSLPFRWCASGTLMARFVRLQLTRSDYLHFDQVEIFGQPVQEL